MFLTFFLCFLFQIQEKKILFIGDSMTSYEGGWQHQVAKKLGKQYDNFSIPGKRTDWMYLTLTDVLSKNNNYSTCFIYGGINDGFSYVKTESTQINLQKMIDLCNRHNIQPVIVVGYSPQSVMVNVYVKNAKPFIDRYIKIQEQMLSLKNCLIIPINEEINRTDSDDGIHFKSSGHQKLSKWVYENYNNQNN